MVLNIFVAIISIVVVTPPLQLIMKLVQEILHQYVSTYKLINIVVAIISIVVVTPLQLIVKLVQEILHQVIKFNNFLTKNKTLDEAKLPPGPRPWPIVGCLPEMVRNRPAFRWIHKLLVDMDTEIACIKLGGVHVIPVASPELSREFLKKHDETFSSRPDCMSGYLASGGYLTAVLSPSSEQWKKMRKVLKSEVVSHARHNWLRVKRDEEANQLVQFVYNNSKGGIVNVREATRYYCGNVMRRIIFNKRFFEENNLEKQREYDHAVFSALDYLYAFDISDYLPWLGIFDFFGHKRIILKAIDCIRKYHNPEIEDRIQMWKKGTKVEEEDILDVLIALKDKDGNPVLTEQEIKAQTREMMMAGVDNPSNAIEWTLAEMITQPSTLERAVEELDKVVGRDRLVQEYDLPQLNYIAACAKESMRLHPIAPFNLPHVSMADTVVGGYFIPKGSHVLLSRIALGRNSRVWEEPLKFKPERHLLNDGYKVVISDPELRLLSFSTGRRGCIATTLGTTMTCMLLARLVQCFTWSIPPNKKTIDLMETHDALYLQRPLLAVAKPRLGDDLYNM